jgi:hypothetical protein
MSVGWQYVTVTATGWRSTPRSNEALLPSFEQVGAPEAGVGFLDPGELGFLAAGEVLRVLPQRVAGVLEVPGVAGGQADGPAAVPDRGGGPAYRTSDRCGGDLLPRRPAMAW